jgi:hypothetical protein
MFVFGRRSAASRESASRVRKDREPVPLGHSELESKGKFQLGVKGVCHFLTEVFSSCSGQYFSIVWLLRSKNMDNLEKVKKSRVCC